MTDDKFKTYGNVFDNYTNKNLFKMITQGLFEGLESPVSIGKEANIFTGVKKDGTTVIIKIYRLETCDFNRMYEYIRTDPRVPNIKKNKRKVIFEWARREYVNLLKAREVGVRVPLPMAIKDNIIVMEKIGKTEVAPKLKDSYADMDVLSRRVIAFMKKLNLANMVHGDLSEFNILEQGGKPIFIDFSQATSLDYPNAAEYVKRDVRNIAKFFRKKGVDITEEEILEKITIK